MHYVTEFQDCVSAYMCIHVDIIGVLYRRDGLVLLQEMERPFLGKPKTYIMQLD